MNQIYQKEISYPDLPLAIYTEIAAHLEQVDGLTVELIPEDRLDFAYHHSQLKGLRIQTQSDPQELPLLQSILDYYNELYGSYSPLL
jgi:hypothetical protein